MERRVGALPYALLLAGIFACAAIFPNAASAAEMSAQTAQVIPPGGTTCIPMPVSGFTSHIYDGKLNSFDFSVPDASYVALAGSVGNTGIPFNLMTRRIDQQTGALLVHVDIPATPIVGKVPLSVTLLSGHGAGMPVCLTVVSATLEGPALPVKTPAVKPSTPAIAPTTGTSGPSAQTSGEATSGEGTVITAAPVAASGIGQSLRGACATPLAAQRTWLVLLLAYLVVVGIVLWAEFPVSLPALRTPERVAAIILILLLGLLGFWYFSAACRTALWMPLAAVLIAVLGLLAAFRNHPKVTQFLLVENLSKSA